MNHQLITHKGGRIFFVGDIHGCYDALELALKKVNFTPANGDIVVSVGDLIDRGPKSMECLNLLYEDWFYSVLGNHEMMMIDAIREGDDSYEASLWASNGGIWYYSLTSPERGEINAIVKDKVEQLPAVITTINSEDKKIGVIHAEATSVEWSKIMRDSGVDNLKEELIWSRRKANFVQKALKNPTQFDHSVILQAINGIDAVVLGHTPMKHGPVFCSNMAWIDTGAVFGNPLTLIEDKILLEYLKRNNSPAQLRVS